MSGVKLDVQWCPSDPNKFITWGTELYLYEVQSHKNVEAPCKSYFIFWKS